MPDDIYQFIKIKNFNVYLKFKVLHIFHCTSILVISFGLQYVLTLLVGFNVTVTVNVVYALKPKFLEEGIGLCEEMGLQPISERFQGVSGFEIILWL